MANQVYANSMEVSCKAADGKSICSMPDVCMTPPQTPATPPGVPVPYPNTGMASDCTDGSTTVAVSDQQVMLKDKSYFKSSTGDEAGAAPMKGVVTGTNRGKVYFTVWSMDVRIEGENVVRNLDMTTHNHASPPGNAAIPWPHVSRVSVPADLPAKPCPKTDCKDGDGMSGEEYEKVRKKTPSRAIKKSINAGVPKTCVACGLPQASLAADHVVPLKIISQMHGFACMSFEDQKQVANDPDNFVGLCTPCNSSKCDKLWARWSGVKTTNQTWSEATIKQNQQQTNDRMVNLKAKIRNAKCEI
jgi:5-methylcytosine-specific restriction endonuclease McrA